MPFATRALYFASKGLLCDSDDDDDDASGGDNTGLPAPTTAEHQLGKMLNDGGMAVVGTPAMVHAAGCCSVTVECGHQAADAVGCQDAF